MWFARPARLCRTRLWCVDTAGYRHAADMCSLIAAASAVRRILWRSIPPFLPIPWESRDASVRREFRSKSLFSPSKLRCNCEYPWCLARFLQILQVVHKFFVQQDGSTCRSKSKWMNVRNTSKYLLVSVSDSLSYQHSHLVIYLHKKITRLCEYIENSKTQIVRLKKKRAFAHDTLHFCVLYKKFISFIKYYYKSFQFATTVVICKFARGEKESFNANALVNYSYTRIKWGKII